MKILTTTSSFRHEGNPHIASLRDAGVEVISNPLGRRLLEEEARALLAEHDPIGMIAGIEPLTELVLSAGPSLKALARCGAGLDNVDMAAAARRGIAVSNTPDAPTQPVAELTLGLILSLLRRIAESDRALRDGRWHQARGRLLSGKTVGLIGFGRIGRRLAALLRPFNVNIIVCDPVYSASEAGIASVSRDDLLAQADIVSLHLPLTEETRHMIGEREIARMKKEAILINAARGGLIDEAALCEALASGRLAGAALDVYEQEPYGGPLGARENALLTCHMGSAAAEARALMEHEAAANLLRDLTPFLPRLTNGGAH